MHPGGSAGVLATHLGYGGARQASQEHPERQAAGRSGGAAPQWSQPGLKSRAAAR
jgi:hypothetical protein